MMETQKKNIPALRFPELEGEWERKRLGEIAIITSGGTPSRIRKDYWNGNIPWVSTSLIDFDTINSTVEFITEEAVRNSATHLFRKGTILMAMYGQGKTRGKVAKLGVDAAVNQACAAIIVNAAVISDYLFQNLSGRYGEIRKLSNEGGQKNLSGGIIKSVMVTFPPLPEQQKIATFLTAVDNKLKALRKKKALLEQYKKGVMQKIFSRELRFKKEYGKDFPEWEEKKLKDIFTITRGNVLAVNKMSAIKNEINKYPVYSSQTKFNGLTGYYSQYLYENSITWTTDGANAGDVKYRKGKFYCTNVCGVLISNKGYANKCISEMINRVSRKYVSYVGNPKLMNNVMAEIKISVPSLEEQAKIADFLSAIDKKIASVEEQIEKTGQWKKGLLQRMFV